ncbi:DNA internalization-related competence protein ComEC/Rec2 [bacterium]|nr:DNA internalization-related competence protein ComEC/Rec2 [bacterium]
MLNAPTRGVLLTAIAFTLGLLAGPFGPASWVRLLLILPLFILMLFLARREAASSLLPTVLALFFLIGWARSSPHFEPPLPEESVYIEGTVAFPSESRADVQRVRLKHLRWSAGHDHGRLPEGALLYVEGGSFTPGMRLRLVGQIETIPGVRNPGGFDAASYWGLRGIKYRVRRVERIEVLGTVGGWSRVEEFYAALRQRIETILARDAWPGTTPLAEALILGDRSGWDEGTRDQLARSGLMHIFAISGLHIGVMLLLFRLLFSLLPVSIRQAEAAALLLVWLVLPLTGMNPPAVRAAVMLSFYVFGRLFQRVNRPGYTLTLAYIILLFFAPAGLRDAGFQLSFAGTAGALFVAKGFDRVEAAATSRKIEGWRHWWSIQLAKVLYAFLISVGAWAATSPFVIYHFGRIPWLASLVSLPAMFLLGLTLAAGWLTLLLAPIPWLTALFGSSLHTMLLGMKWLAGVSESLLPITERLPVQAVVMAMIAVVFMALMTRRIADAPVAGGLLVITGVAALMVWFSLMLPANRTFLLAIDVGQGDGFLLRRGERAVLIDGGDSYQHATDQVLRSSGIRSLDLLLLTHGDADHAGAAARLAEQIPIRAALVGPATMRDKAGKDAVLALLREGVPVFVGHAGTSIDLGKMGKMKVISPSSEFLQQPRLGDNDLSLVTIWEVDSSRALFPGDATDRTERSMLREAILPDVDLLVAGHHGSRHSSLQTFLEVVDPEVVLISAGRNNRYGHPATEVLGRLDRMGLTPLRTDQQGASLLEAVDGSFVKRPWFAWW